MTEDAHDFSVEEYDMNAVLGSGSKEQCGGENADVPPADGGKQRAGDGDTPAEEGGASMAEPAPQNGQNEEETTVPEDIFEDMIPGQVAQDKPEESAPEQVAQDKPEESAPGQVAQDKPEESAPGQVAQDIPGESAEERSFEREIKQAAGDKGEE